MDKFVERASYSPSMKRVKLNTRDSASIIAHEYAHAVDNMWCDGNGYSFWTSASIYIQGLEIKKGITSKDGNSYRQWFRNIRSDEKGLYSNGDGEYWKDNWIHNYEGRIYRGANGYHGIEWWTMNVQRFQEYYIKRMDLTVYEKRKAALEKSIAETNNLIDKFGTEKTIPMYKKAIKKYEDELYALNKFTPEEYAEIYAGKTWQKVRQRYPELAQFIEDNFGKRFISKDNLGE